LPPLARPGWTLLVQGVDLHVPAAHALLRCFRFVPDARLDDLMVSFASDGGGVGPHIDSYDVFLLQVAGRRRWRIGRASDRSLRGDVPLKMLARFAPEHEWTLDAGDLLYLPPGWAHDGDAVGGGCMTCSIGFRAPGRDELARELLLRIADATGGAQGPIYRDPRQRAAVAAPARIPDALRGFASAAVERALRTPRAVDRALGEFLSEPKPQTRFEPGAPLRRACGVRLDARTRMMYDTACLYCNGEACELRGGDARLLCRLADRRALSAAEVGRLDRGTRRRLDAWAQAGWLHAGEDETASEKTT
jgi:50S ribosomal protein L16 3-hydroxylase